ncbi:MAG: 2-oxoacid:acceptor oxidoreductase family protein [Bacillota bacterium]
MYEQVIIAGFGGQGVLTCGQILALAAMAEGKYVTWMPSYGPEQRGGTASCVVTLSDRPIGSPLAEDPTAALVFNRPSLVKFEPRVKAGGLLLINSSIIKAHHQRADLVSYRVPADEIARRMGLSKAANVVMLGSYLAVSRVVSVEAVKTALGQYLGAKKQHLVEVNLKALAAGQDFVTVPGLAVGI